MATAAVPAHQSPKRTEPDDPASIPKDFGYLPIPKRLRYDPDKPFYFGMMLNISFGVGATFSEFSSYIPRVLS